MEKNVSLSGFEQELLNYDELYSILGGIEDENGSVYSASSEEEDSDLNDNDIEEEQNNLLFQ